MTGDHLVRLLPGGYSGSLVALIWTDHLEPIVLKAGPVQEIEAEHGHRQNYTGGDPWLTAHGLDGVHGPIEVEVDDRPVLWAAIAYRYIGGKSFEELDNFSDVERLVQAYLWNANRDESPSEPTVRECFRTIAATLADGPSDASTVSAAPLIKYLPPVQWETGILAALNTARSFCPDLPELIGFHEWWEESIASVRIAPVHDDRLLHGDVRFANILVDSVHSDVHFIDFGSGRRGHVFEDFARFEIDLLFRATPRVDGGDGALDRSALLESVEFLLRDELNLGKRAEKGNRLMRCLDIWHQVMFQAFPQMTRPGALVMYRWFLLRECLKRTRWTSGAMAGDEEPDAASLIYTICALRQSLSGKKPAGTWISTAPQVLASTLHCRAAFVPTRGSERLVNQKRNEAKKAALRESAAKISTVRLLAETGQSYLSARGAFNSEIRDVLATGAGVMVAICNPHAPEYYGLSKAYEATGDIEQPLSAILLRKSEESIRGYRALREEFGSLIEVRLCRFGVGATILLTDQAAFFEPYFRTRRTKRETLLFDSFELQFDSSGLHSATLLQETFDFHWRNSDHIDDVAARPAGYEALRSAFLNLWR
ncbi:phosphotransferase [Streptomyces sp. NPDC059989]|uniref:phosphotransferase n=1 Tax=Streptomyces sp. NPDC059989 TaxID=3347026 RepID=UPI0036840258